MKKEYQRRNQSFQRELVIVMNKNVTNLNEQMGVLMKEKRGCATALDQVMSERGHVDRFRDLSGNRHFSKKKIKLLIRD